MKTKTFNGRFALITVTCMIAGISIGRAAGLSSAFSSTDGGGGTCAGGNGTQGRPKFVMDGTAGQPDAGFCTGSTYVHQGGFLPAFQKDAGPALRMTRSPASLTFTWPNACTGFVLEGARDVTGPWSALGSGTAGVTTWQQTLTTPTPYRFFRLRKDCPQ